MSFFIEMIKDVYRGEPPQPVTKMIFGGEPSPPEDELTNHCSSFNEQYIQHRLYCKRLICRKAISFSIITSIVLDCLFFASRNSKAINSGINVTLVTFALGAIIESFTKGITESTFQIFGIEPSDLRPAILSFFTSGILVQAIAKAVLK
ncbi:MAG: hypothetical protein K940chlam1_00401 [Candidatus Anoxychlamydiales bacterium]|nr:hypothetical protein [Candidatus Anoxychlamydiales bacterium]